MFGNYTRNTRDEWDDESGGLMTSLTVPYNHALSHSLVILLWTKEFILKILKQKPVINKETDSPPGQTVIRSF